MAGFGQDLAYAVRTLGKKPAFAVTAGATLALGIGAASAIFQPTDPTTFAVILLDEGLVGPTFRSGWRLRGFHQRDYVQTPGAG
jgi:hypothetical protein